MEPTTKNEPAKAGGDKPSLEAVAKIKKSGDAKNGKRGPGRPSGGGGAPPRPGGQPGQQGQRPPAGGPGAAPFVEPEVVDSRYVVDFLRAFHSAGHAITGDAHWKAFENSDYERMGRTLATKAVNVPEPVQRILVNVMSTGVFGLALYEGVLGPVVKSLAKRKKKPDLSVVEPNQPGAPAGAE